ncbi:MAG: antitoxin AF2212-like protein [Pirellulales bacterium]
MTIQFAATYQNGVLLPEQPIAIPEGTQVMVSVEAKNLVDDPLAEVIGIGDGPEAGDAADKHDRYIYQP